VRGDIPTRSFLEKSIMFARVFIGSVLVLGLLLVGMSLANEKPTKDCCATGLACCNPARACCAAEAKLACCEKGMKCCADKKACCDAPQKCCTEGQACCEQAKACCGAPSGKSE
jgi:hypothetical protein